MGDAGVLVGMVAMGVVVVVAVVVVVVVRRWWWRYLASKCVCVCANGNEVNRMER